MKVDRQKVELCMARRGLCVRDLGVSADTLRRAMRGGNTTPKVVGKIAAALGVDPVEIIVQKEEREDGGAV
jgi:lambda repressor-like predicted transcriptional regulator